MRPLSLGSLTLLIAATAIACAGVNKEIQLDPMEFTAVQTPDGLEVELLDPEVLFSDAAKSFDEQLYDNAVRKFSLIVKHFDMSPLARPALFNRGLALLKMPRPADAAADFETFIEKYGDDADIQDAWQRLGQAYLESGRWNSALEALIKRLTMEPLVPTMEVELRARKAKALRMLAKFEDARREVRRVLAIADEHATKPEIKGNYYVAMASFEGAETYHDLFARIRFTLPTERMEKDLTDKATLFLKAQSEYLRTVRLQNIFWGVRAGVRLGQMYEEFYETIMTAEVPPEFNPEELEIYMNELKKQARPLIAKAVDSYERNMAMARMYGAKDEWFGDMPARLARLRKILESLPK